MKSGHIVLAYHGCDITTRDQLVSGQLGHLDNSNNKYDWLGPGVYFFEDDPARALMFAAASHRTPEKLFTARPIATPAVVGAILRVQNWLDMTTQDGIQEFAHGYAALVDYYTSNDKQMPENSRAGDEDRDILLRRLDNAVFHYIHGVREQMDLPDFQAVRAAFPQGQEIAPLSGFRLNTHVQIALRERTCIAGWFLPLGAKLLTDAEYRAAEDRLEIAKASYAKPKVRNVRTS